MFFLKSVMSQSNVQIVCRNFARHTAGVKDPGIGRRKNLLKVKENEDLDFEDLEADFMDVHESHKQHLQDLKTQKEREKYLIVRQKYFKEKYPNFLTWHDKEQIRYLHRIDPEEWTIEHLSAGFPALPETITKIVKSNWTKDKQNKVTNHDASVQKNWRSFKKGQMPNLPQELLEHLNKFTNRALNLKPFVIPDSKETSVVVKNKNIGTEFVDIIKSYEKLKKEMPQVEPNSITTNTTEEPPHKETYIATPSHRKKLVTFDQLQQNLVQRADAGKHMNEGENYIISNLKQEEKQPSGKTELVDLAQSKYETGIRHSKKTERDLSHLKYPEYIRIPKKIHKRGVLYKLNDCYYDDDGEFLYRVPGMT